MLSDDTQQYRYLVFLEICFSNSLIKDSELLERGFQTIYLAILNVSEVLVFQSPCRGINDKVVLLD